MSMTYGEFLLSHLKDEVVELCLSEDSGEMQYFDYTTTVRSVIRGKLVDGDGNCLVLECPINNKEPAIVFINDYSIRAVMKIRDDGISIANVINDQEQRKRTR